MVQVALASLDGLVHRAVRVTARVEPVFVGVLVEDVHPLLVRPDGLYLLALAVEVVEVASEEVPLVVWQRVVVDEDAELEVVRPQIEETEARLCVARLGDEVRVLVEVLFCEPRLAVAAVEHRAVDVLLV